MISISGEPPPNESDPSLRDYLVRLRNEINSALSSTNRWTSVFNLPAKPRDGDVRYFGRAVPPEITTPGFWGYENGSWRSLTLDSLEVVTLVAVDDAGDGTIEGDFNATDFSQLLIEDNMLVLVNHKQVQYTWVGPRNVTVGVGGGYAAVNSDFAPNATVDHRLLTNRDAVDSHPQSAVTGLVAGQAAQDSNISSNTAAINAHVSDTSDPHNTQVFIDASIAAHVAEYDPHPQYVLEGYGGLVKTTDTNYGSLSDGVWTVIDNWDEGMLFSPRYVVQDVANSGLRFEEQGIYGFSGTFAISFDDVNRGRTFGVRLWNATKGVAGRPVEYFVGRNQEGVNISQGALLAEIGLPEVNDLFQIQIAALGDTFNPVTVVDALYSAKRVGL